MKEYIEKAALIAAMKSGVSPLFNLSSDAGRMYLDMLERVQNFPAADVAEVRHGRWIDVRGESSGLNWKCSLCAKRVLQKSPCCPNCGARMDKEGEHEVS